MFNKHKTGLTITYRASATFKVVKTRLENIYKTAVGFLKVRNVFPKHAVVKAALLNL